MNAFEMSEQHLDLLPELASDRVLGGLGNGASDVSGKLVDRPCHLALRLLRTAPYLLSASLAVGFTSAIANAGRVAV